MARKVERESSFAVKQPELLKLWDFNKNTLDPYKISDGSHQKAWFICPECGKSYIRAIRDIVSVVNKTCLTCRPKILKTGISFAEKCPELLDEWDYEKNSENPCKVPYSSHKKIFWKCSNNHSYITTPNQKSSYEKGCPYCSNQKVLPGFNDLLSQDPTLAEQWDYNKNELIPNKITKSSGKKVWWICPNCKKSYQASPNSRQDGTACPYCDHTSTSFPEQFILRALKTVFGEDKVLSRDKTAIGKELDIYIPHLNFAIEPGDYKWHSKENKIKIDKTKKMLCKTNNIVLLSIIYNSPVNSYKGLSWKLKSKLTFAEKEAILALIYKILSFLNFKYVFSQAEINKITETSYLNSRRMSTQDFISRLSKTNSNIIVLGDFISQHTKIEVSCSTCGNTWKSMPYSLLQGTGCPNCCSSRPVVCIDTGETFYSLKQAAEKINRNSVNIIQAIKSNRKCAGLRWKYITKEEYNELHRE